MRSGVVLVGDKLLGIALRGRLARVAAGRRIAERDRPHRGEDHRPPAAAWMISQRRLTIAPRFDAGSSPSIAGNSIAPT
jgi:hypothetical protein